ncbi:MAG: DNA polymerase IV [Verrucomicrobiota bacterium]
MRSIVHLDADAFFAAVEQASDPKLRGKPIAVGGEKRGIIASASYEARKFGVYTPMPTVRARKLCPKLIVLPGDFDRYEQFSHWMFGYCYDFTPDVEQTSIDEGYFDLTATRKPPAEIAQIIRRAIAQKLKISVSEGIGTNKLVSAIASKLNKPAAFSEVPPGTEIAFLHPLPNQWLPGIGPKTSARLNAAGLARIRHVADTPIDHLALLLGSQAETIRQFARGIDPRPLIPVREPQKSFSRQETFAQDQTDEEFLHATLRRMADHLFAKVREEQKSIRTLTLKIRYNDMSEDQAGESLEEPTDLETDVYGRLQVMLRQAWRRRVSLRMLSLKLSNLYDSRFRSELPLDLPWGRRDARERLAAIVDDLRRSRGHSVLLRGHDLFLKDEGRREKAEPARWGETPSSPDPGRAGVPAGPNIRLPRRNSSVRDGGDAVPPRVSPHRHSAFRIPRSALGFVPLRVRSHYSFLDSTLSPADIVGLAKRHGLKAVAMTDFGNLHGAVEFVQAARAAGIKPILGAELRLGNHPLLLYVQNARGYHNLNRLLSQKAESRMMNAEETAVAARQRAPLPSNFKLHTSNFLEGLIAVSTDPGLAPLFPGRFYKMATQKDFGDGGTPSLPTIACPAVHYAMPEDRLRYDILQSIRTLTLLRQAHPDKNAHGRFHFRTPSDLAIVRRDRPGWLEATLEIADRCEFDLPFGKPQFPAYRPPDGSAPGDFLRQLVLDGARRRYPRSHISNLKSQISNLKCQIEEELRIIREVGYEEYFLITWDFLQECRRRGIEWITRGSAADSLVCYCLGISGVCPVRFDLYFRRFLNRERMAMHKLPDIDIDFAHDRKDDVVKLIFEKYGPERCAVVGGFSTFQARSAFAEVAKVLGMAEREVRKFTEHFPWGFGGGWVPDEPAPHAGEGLVELLRASPETRDLPMDEEPYRTALHMAEFLDGMPRHPKMHPCGVVLSRQPMHELTPTFISNKGYPTTHFDMDAVEAVGLVKMDILAQAGLAVMRDVKASLANRGIEVDLERCAAKTRNRPSSSSSNRGAGVLESWSDGRDELCESHSLSPIQLGTRSSSSLPAPPATLHDSISRWGETPSSPDPRSRNREIAESPHCTGLDRVSPHPHSPSATSTFCIPPSAFDDPRVWDMIAGGGARAVHHIESPAMTSLCRMCHVREIDGLIAIVSVIRPGAANEGKKIAFTRRYQGFEPPEYPHPSLEPCLRSTYGLVVYEEHILQLCECFAGLSPGRADILRRALNKQKRAMIEEIRGEFFASARARGHAPEKIAEVWSLATGFAGYAFCKAHSTAYGVEAYQSAWLKYYYPAEFMAAVLTHGKGFYHPLVYVLECHRLGIRLLPPSVNAPGPHFSAECGVRPARRSLGEGGSAEKARWGETPSSPDPGRAGVPAGPNIRLPRRNSSDGDGGDAVPPGVPHSAFRTPHWIRVPLTRVKGLSESTIDRTLRERERGPFTSLPDFARRVRPAREELEAMIRAGGFDEFGDTRTRQFWQAQFQCGVRNAECGVADTSEFPAFQAPDSALRTPHSALEEASSHSALRTPHSALEEPSRLERLAAETELFGFAVSGHPLELFPDVAWDTYCPVNRLGEFAGQTVTTCGLVVEQRTHHQVTGEPMKFLTLADWTGMVETELFAQTYKSYGLATVRYPVLEVEARVEPFENGRGFSLRVLHAGKPRSARS